jgi:hypothetical protein
MFDQIVAVIDLVLLVLIWKDGRSILQVERKNYELYDTHINEIRAERLRRQGQLAAARQAKANKAARKNETASGKTPLGILDARGKNAGGSNVAGG